MNRRKTRNGFTMVELMAVLIILGLLATLLLKNFMGSTDKARIITTKTNLTGLQSLVNQFKIDNGRFPTEDEGLTALIIKPGDVKNWPEFGYLDTTDLPKDGWGNEFIYEVNPVSGKAFLIRSCGPDGERGTDDDLLSTDAN
jgi:general secretion pathway protein G